MLDFKVENRVVEKGAEDSSSLSIHLFSCIVSVNMGH